MTHRITLTRHRALNAGLLAAWLLLIAIMQQLAADPDQALADDAASAPATELAQRREWHTRQTVCLRTAGLGAEPSELPDGTYTCRQPQAPAVHQPRPHHTVVATR